MKIITDSRRREKEPSICIGRKTLTKARGVITTDSVPVVTSERSSGNLVPEKIPVPQVILPYNISRGGTSRAGTQVSLQFPQNHSFGPTLSREDCLLIDRLRLFFFSVRRPRNSPVSAGRAHGWEIYRATHDEKHILRLSIFHLRVADSSSAHC